MFETLLTLHTKRGVNEQIVVIEHNHQLLQEGYTVDIVDGRNPAPVEGTVVYPIIYKLWYIQTGDCLGFLNHQQYCQIVTCISLRIEPAINIHQPKKNTNPRLRGEPTRIIQGPPRLINGWWWLIINI